MGEYAKAAAEIIKLGLSDKESRGGELKLGWDDKNGVSLYTNNTYKSVDSVATGDYMSIRFSNIDVTFSGGVVREITFDRVTDSIFLDINLWLRDAKAALMGDASSEAVDYMLKAPGGTNIVEEKIVEVENSEHKTKADILDQLLSRSLSID